MGRYSAIAEMSERIGERLRQALVPDLIPDRGGIVMCSPDNCEDCTLGIFLYDIQENDELRQIQMVDIDGDRQKGPPAYLSLYYMITAYRQGERQFGAIQQERILGKVIQHFHDDPILDGQEGVRMQMLKLSTEDKLKLWNFGGKPYTVSVFYKASPVAVESDVIKNVTRVSAAEFAVSPQERREKNGSG